MRQKLSAYDGTGNLVSDTTYEYDSEGNQTAIYLFHAKVKLLVPYGIFGYGGATSVLAVALDTDSVGLVVGGETKTLSATVIPSTAVDQNVTWASGDTSIVVVEDGVLTPISIGSVLVAVTTDDGGFEAEATVTVGPDAAVYARVIPVPAAYTTDISTYRVAVDLATGGGAPITDATVTVPEGTPSVLDIDPELPAIGVDVSSIRSQSVPPKKPTFQCRDMPKTCLLSCRRRTCSSTNRRKPLTFQ